jgi:hypothetical protein
VNPVVQPLPQSVVPAGHAQVPLTHVSRLAVHGLSHAPQWAVSLERSAQSAPHVTSPAMHAQTADVHICTAEHALPHPPQFAFDVVVSTHVPAQSS